MVTEEVVVVVASSITIAVLSLGTLVFTSSTRIVPGTFIVVIG